MVVTAADADGFERWLYKGRPLRTDEIIKWLIWGLPRKKYRYCGFYFGYDQCMILQTLPEDILRELYKVDEQISQITPPQVALADPYIIERFSTRITFAHPVVMPKEVPEDTYQLGGPRIDIWDVGKFYTQAFAKVLSNYPDLVKPDERRIIERMKGERASFDSAYWEKNAVEIIRYSLLENRLLARIQNRFDRDAADQGYPLKAWYGAGSLAKSMLRHEGVVAHLEAAPPIPEAMREPVDWSYFGGRFEIQAPGPVETEVWEHDITSAYPAAYRVLPCRLHGRWTWRKARPKSLCTNDLCHVKWRVTGSRFGPFPMRHHAGKVWYPYAGEGWYWGHEVLPALELWGRRAVSVRDVWAWARDACDCPAPLAWISGPYKRRRALGKASAGYPLKIGMNAVYGSLVSPLSPRYWEPVWGSMITAYVRGQLLQAMAIATSLDNVVMLATDAIYTTERLPLDEGPELGQWEIKPMGTGGILIQPGLYHFPGIEASEAKFKSRGINQQDIIDNIDQFYREWERSGWSGTVTLRLRPRFVSIRAGLCRHKLTQVSWRWTEDETRDITFNPTLKRLHTVYGWMPPAPPAQPTSYRRFLATWNPEHFTDPGPGVLLDLAELDQPEGPMT